MMFPPPTPPKPKRLFPSGPDSPAVPPARCMGLQGYVRHVVHHFNQQSSVEAAEREKPRAGQQRVETERRAGEPVTESTDQPGQENVYQNLRDLLATQRKEPPGVNGPGASDDRNPQHEPLCQTFQTKVVTEQLNRQAPCRQSKQRWGLGDGDGTSGTLWQELPSVRLSGVLSQLTSEECKRQESMFEVVTSEASYLRSLRVLTDHFMTSRALDEALIIRDKKTLFSNILRVQEISESFLQDLEERVDQAPVISDICDIIHRHAQNTFPTYVDYVRNQTYQEKLYSLLMQKNAQFATVISRLQESPQCQRLPFMSFLLLPFQRITRIRMLTENVLKRTKEGTEEEKTASLALAAVSKVVKECNSQVGRMKQTEELIHLANVLHFDKLKAIPIISQNRFLEKRGELHESARGGVFSLRSKFTPLYLLLFNDLLIVSSRRSTNTNHYVVTDHAHRSLVQVQSVGADHSGPMFKKCFFLIMLENHRGQTSKRLLKAPTQSDMHRWMAAFPNLSRDGGTEEVVYEDWDCPQVQCKEQYVAQQTDELSLEPNNIINVLRKTNEGWYEGIRLSDGEKGWFPSANVLEVTNEHVRRRNLREQYRILHAATGCEQ